MLLLDAETKQTGSIGTFIAIGTAIGGVVAFAWGVYRYYRAQKWKEAEFISKEAKEFNADPATIVVKQLLDWTWSGEDLALSPDKPDVVTRITDALVQSALRIPQSDSESFTDDEYELRGLFDQFFDNLDRFGSFLRAELIAPDDVRPYFEYWMKIITGVKAAPGTSTKSSDYLEAMQRYIDFYGWKGVQLLFKECGHPLTRFKWDDKAVFALKPEILMVQRRARIQKSPPANPGHPHPKEPQSSQLR